MDQLTSALKEFGWSTYEAKCYTGLVKYGSMKASDLATETDINNSKIYQPLQKLEEKGYIRIIDDNPKVYAAQNPKYVVDEEKRNWEENSQQVLNKLQEAWEIQQELAEEEESAWVVKGRKGQRHEAKKAVEAAEESVWAFDKGLAQVRGSFIRELETAAENGVDIRIIGGPQANRHLNRLDSVASETGIISDVDKPSFYVIDDEKSVLILSGGRNSVVLDNAGATRIITEELERVAEKASEVPQND